MNQLFIKIKNLILQHKLFIFFFIFTLVFLHIYYVKKLILIDSDNSAMLLNTADFLNGNIFFKGWYNDWFSTGITYITTDMLSFILAFKLFNISSTSIIFAWTLNIFMCIVIAFLLIKDEIKEITVSNLIIFLGLIGLSYYFIFFLHFHSGCFIYYFLVCLMAAKYLKTSDTKYLFFIFVFCTLATLGDLITIAIIICPIFVYSLLQIFHKSNIKKNLYLILSVSLSSFIGYILLHFFLKYHTISVNHTKFMYFSFQDCVERIFITINQLSLLSGVDFYYEKIFAFNAWISFTRYIFLILGLYLLYINIKKCLLNKNSDFISSYLSFSIFIVILFLLLTNNNEDIYCARYISFLAISFSVIIMRHYNCFENLNNYQFKFIICFLLFLLSFSVISSYKKENIYSAKIKEITSILEQKNLKNGINSDYWTSSVITVYSRNSIKVRPIEIIDNNIKPLKFYSKDEWYTEPVEFVILIKENDKYNTVLDKELTEKSNQVIEKYNYKIYLLNKKYDNYTELQ